MAWSEIERSAALRELSTDEDDDGASERAVRAAYERRSVTRDVYMTCVRAGNPAIAVGGEIRRC